MTMSHQILIPVDGSKQSRDAVRYVSRLFPPEGTRVVVFYVMSKVPEFFDDLGRGPELVEGSVTAQAWARALTDSVNFFMDECHGLLSRKGFSDRDIVLKTVERQVGIARDIVTESQGGYTGVVIGRTGLNPEMGNLLGSVASKLLEKVSHTSLCLVGGRPDTGKALVALDVSENALRGMDFVASLGGGSISEVKLFHVLRGIEGARVSGEDVLDREHMAEFEEWDKKEIQAVFGKAKEKLESGGMDPGSIHSHVVSGVSSRAAAIVQEAREGGFGTIVVGRRGLSKVQEFFIGRVGNKVIHLADDRAVWVIS